MENNFNMHHIDHFSKSFTQAITMIDASRFFFELKRFLTKCMRKQEIHEFRNKIFLGYLMIVVLC